MNTRRSLNSMMIVLFILSTVFSSSAQADQNNHIDHLRGILKPELIEPAPDWIASSDPTPFFGDSINSAGDVNNDGFGDVIIGAPYFTSGGNQGKAFAYYGSVDGLSSTSNWSTLSPTPGYVSFGENVSTAGDVNGDEYDDVLISETGSASTYRGKVFLYYGSSTGINTTHGWSREGADNEFFGYALDGPCNVNGDAYDDILVTSFGYSNPEYREGAVFVFHGSATGPAAVPDWSFESNEATSMLGYNVACAGDVNNDGFDEVIAGAYYQNYPTFSGKVWVWYGSPTGLDSAHPWTKSGTGNNFNLGFTVDGIGDVNGDAYDDVIVSAMSNYHAYIYRGSATGLETNSAWDHTEGIPSDGYAVEMTGLGDLNADGYEDFAVGAPYTGGDARGSIYVYYGSASGAPATYTWRVSASEVNSYLGQVLGQGGDVDGDLDTELLASMRPSTSMAFYGHPDEAITGLGSASSSPDLIGETTYFTAAIGTGSYVTYAWDFGDGQSGTGAQVSHTYAHEGFYTVTLTATNFINSQVSDTQVHIQRTCWARLNNSPTDFLSVQAAVDASTSSTDVVKVAGTCTEINADGGHPQIVYLDKTLIVRGGYTTTNWTDPDYLLYPTVLDAQGLGRVIYATGSVTPTLEGLNITGGDGSDLGFGPPEGGSSGGGIAVDSAGLILDNVKIYNNQITGAGAAIANYQNALSIRDSQIYSNTAIYDVVNDYAGGGGLDLFQSTLHVENSAFLNNTTEGYGGAMRLEEVSTTIISTTFESNRADYAGGAVWATHHRYFFQDCSFRGNQAGEDGGAVFAEEMFVSFERCLFQDNTAIQNGGAAFLGGSERPEMDFDISSSALIDNQSGSLGSGLAINTGNGTLKHLTLANNTSPGGAGLDIWNVEYETSVVTMTNSLISDPATGIRINSDDLLTIDGVLWDATTPVTLTHVTTATVDIQNQLVGDPAFALDGYHITATSDAIDSGVPGGVNYDIDNQPRPMFSGYDLGADEYPDTPITGLIAESSGPTLLEGVTWFTATISAGTSVSYAWDFGDGGHANGASTFHSYAASGVYTASVTASNPLGALSDNLFVTIYEVRSLPPGGSVGMSNGALLFTSPITQTETFIITYTPALTTSHPTTGFEIAGMLFHLQATGTGGLPVTIFSPPLTLELHYEQSALPPGSDESQLTLQRYDAGSSSWVPLTVISRDTAANTLIVSLDHLSEFALLIPTEQYIYIPMLRR